MTFPSIISSKAEPKKNPAITMNIQMIIIPAAIPTRKPPNLFTPDRTGTYCVQLFYPAETPPQIYSVGGKQPSFIIVDAKAPTCLAVSEIEDEAEKLGVEIISEDRYLEMTAE